MIESNPVCKHCNSINIRKDGIVRYSRGDYQRYFCKDCGRKTIDAPYIDSNGDKISFEQFPSDDIPVEEIIEQQIKSVARKIDHADASKWFNIKINEKKPIGVAFIGDPHIDNSGCNWLLLKKHIELLKTDGVYSVGIGDYTDNWVGRLTRLYAKSNMSRTRAIKVAKWFIGDSGINWMVLIRGNHDMWSPELDDPLMWMETGAAPKADWKAQFQITFPNKRICKVDARHNFKGHSMWNSLHGMQKAAHMFDSAHIYVAGHTHNWALHQEEAASKQFTYWLARARGYKYVDEYANILGYDEQKDGATILAIIDPNKYGSSFVQCFVDLEAGVEYLTYLRNK